MGVVLRLCCSYIDPRPTTIIPTTKTNTPKTGIKGMTLSAILVNGAAAIAFLFFLGRSVRRGLWIHYRSRDAESRK